MRDRRADVFIEDRSNSVYYINCREAAEALGISQRKMERALKKAIEENEFEFVAGGHLLRRLNPRNAEHVLFGRYNKDKKGHLWVYDDTDERWYYDYIDAAKALNCSESNVKRALKMGYKCCGHELYYRKK